MKLRSLRISNPAPRLLLAAVCSLPLGNACSNDDGATEAPTTFGVEVVKLDGQAPDGDITLRCDRGGPADAADTGAGGASTTAAGGAFTSVSVAVSLTPTDLATYFVLRPANACGTSTRCGFVRIEGLDEAGQVLASVDTATTEGVLELELGHLPVQLRVSLIRGVDRKPLQNPDGADVVTLLTPNLIAPSDCTADTGGSGGAGGEAALPPGGANTGGAGGEAALPPGGAGAGGAGGAAGEGNVPTLGGAGAGGADDAISGAGGA